MLVSFQQMFVMFAVYFYASAKVHSLLGLIKSNMCSVLLSAHLFNGCHSQMTVLIFCQNLATVTVAESQFL